MLTKVASSRALKLRALSESTAQAALMVAAAQQATVLHAAETLASMADRLERQSQTSESAVMVLPHNATQDELHKARRRQATRCGNEVFLPSWSAMAQALPNALLRSALFSCSRKVQSLNDDVMAGDTSLLVANKTIATFKNLNLMFSGYELCQFDRQVYSACLDYYREVPLSPETCNRSIQTSFYAFANRMGSEYSVKLHRAIRASLLRLSFAQVRIRYDRLNLEVPKLLSVSFEDGDTGNLATSDMRGSDMIFLRVTESVAELFGPGCWSAIDKKAVDYDGLKGWVANFYATHRGPQWLSLKSLYRLSGYESRLRNFRHGFRAALEKLKSAETPFLVRISGYQFSQDEERVIVHRTAWASSEVTDNTT